MKENEVEDYLYAQAKKYDALCFKFISPQNSGVPDRIIIKDGIIIFIELKKPKERPRPLQRAMIKTMRRHGAKVCVIDNKDMIDEFFANYPNGPTLE